MTSNDIPLFPLSSVLLPGGTVSLRIFERRYLDMIRDCARQASGFGVCLILDGHEAGAPAVPAAVGTLARITDFHTREDGLLGIHAEGGRRFRVSRTRVRDNGLIHGEVRFLDEDLVEPLPAHCSLLATILERLYDRIGGDPAKTDRTRFDDAAWVGWRLAEALPLEPAERQHLLQTDGAVARLERLLHIIPRFQNA